MGDVVGILLGEDDGGLEGVSVGGAVGFSLGEDDGGLVCAGVGANVLLL